MSRRRPRRAWLAGAILLMLFGAPVARGAGVQGGAGVQAFLLPTAPDSLLDLQAHAADVSVVYPTYFECESGSGAIEGHDEPGIDAAIAALHTPMLPRFTCQDGPTVHLLLNEPRLRAWTLRRLLALARHPGYAGLSLDLENAPGEDRGALSSFVATLAGGLHAMHRKLTVVIDGVPREEPRRQTYLYDDRAISALADNVFVLAWGVHWAGSEPGPIAPLPWVRQIVARLATLPHARRFVLGAPMYGLDWIAGAGGGSPAAGQGAGSLGQAGSPGQAGGQGQAGGSARIPGPEATARQFADVAALAHGVKARPLRDRTDDELTFAYDGSGGVPHRVWYLDGRAIRDRLRLARSYGLAVGVWRLGREDQALWASPFVS